MDRKFVKSHQGHNAAYIADSYALKGHMFYNVPQRHSHAYEYYMFLLVLTNLMCF